MSSHVIPVGRPRASSVVSVLALVVAVVAAVGIAVLGVIDATRAGSSQARVPAPAAVPTPDWLQRYLEFEAPVVVPTPDWLQRYLEFEAPESADSGGPAGTLPVNAGHR
jgi:hypothetical protein